MSCALDHEHDHGGKSYCYHHGGCRCEPCVTASAERQRAMRRAKAYGRHEPMVDATGTRRRIQALNALGWSDRRIGEQCGMGGKNVYSVKTTEKTTPKTRKAIAKAYEALSMRVPEFSQSVSYVRNQARRHGWVPPLAWDDIDNDPRPIRESPARVLRGDKLYAEIEHLREAGESAHQIAKALGKTADALSQAAFARGRHEMATFFRHAVAHERATEYGAEHRERGAA